MRKLESGAATYGNPPPITISGVAGKVIMASLSSRTSRAEVSPFLPELSKPKTPSLRLSTTDSSDGTDSYMVVRLVIRQTKCQHS